LHDALPIFAQALFNPDKINDLLRKELQQAVNNLLEAELTAFLGYDPYARNGWNTGNSRNGAYFRKVDTQFGPIEVQVPRDRNGQFQDRKSTRLNSSHVAISYAVFCLKKKKKKHGQYK